MNPSEPTELLFSGYFNLNWGEDYDEPSQVIEAFIADEPEELQTVIKDVRAMLVEYPNDEDLRTFLIDTMSCAYNPPSDGLTYRAWLLSVADRVERRLTDRPE